MFWRVEHPDYPSETADRLVNGELSHSFGMPGVHCARCGQTWAGNRVLPFALPPSLCDRLELRNRWPIDADAHRALRAKVLRELRESGAALETVEPGDSFPPALLDVAAPPDADFLWGAHGSVVVSDRVKGALNSAGIRGATFAPVICRVGRRAPAARRMTRSAEAPDPVSYHELIVTAESAYPPGVDPTFCESCGRRSFDHDRRQLVMVPQMWRGDDVFRLATTLWIVVTDAVRQRIEELHPSNVVFRKLDSRVA